MTAPLASLTVPLMLAVVCAKHIACQSGGKNDQQEDTHEKITGAPLNPLIQLPYFFLLLIENQLDCLICAPNVRNRGARMDQASHQKMSYINVL